MIFFIETFNVYHVLFYEEKSTTKMLLILSTTFWFSCWMLSIPATPQASNLAIYKRVLLYTCSLQQFLWITGANLNNKWQINKIPIFVFLHCLENEKKKERGKTRMKRRLMRPQ